MDNGRNDSDNGNGPNQCEASCSTFVKLGFAQLFLMPDYPLAMTVSGTAARSCSYDTKPMQRRSRDVKFYTTSFDAGKCTLMPPLETPIFNIFVS